MNAPSTLTHVFYANDTETPTDPTGTPTFEVVDAAGTAVDDGDALITGDGSGTVTASLAAQTATKLLTVTWSATVGGVALVETDVVEIVSGWYFSLAAARNSDASLADVAKYTTAEIRDVRSEVETELEQICDRSFVPRYARVTLDGTGSSTLQLTHPDPDRSVFDVRTIRSVKMATEVDETFVAFTTDELDDLAIGPDGTIRRSSGAIFTEGRDNVVVEYEYGLSVPPPDLVKAALIRLRSRLNLTRTGIPDRATSYQSADGGTYRITLPDAYRTGIPEVDAAYSRYSRRVRTGPNGGPVPAGRTLMYEPQRFSIFHRPSRR